MAIAEKIRASMERASWIRKMFEEGARLKAERGEEKVFDFSLGNPCVEPPARYLEALEQCLREPRQGKYGYMPNAGHHKTREAIAAEIRSKRRVAIEGRHVVMTCGAAGGLNIVLKTVLDPGDEVLILSPFFPEYLFYVDNHGGRPRIVPTRNDFALDLGAIESALTDRTRAILVNSPNNPTGRMYDLASLRSLGGILDKCREKTGRQVFLVSDEPYAEILFDSRRLPDLFGCYRDTIIVSSFSKSLSIPGERLGYVAVNPALEGADVLVNGLTFCNRILGFVNAPATAQNAVSRALGTYVQAAEYQRRRDLLCQGLREIGYKFQLPDGAFYLFPQSPVADEIPFVQALMEQGVLVVPGSGFGAPGYFRIAFCVGAAVLRNALPGFAAALKRFG
ncbi:MAG: pyridoxal phosphate-dependent aminotransferase [bacterium]